VSETLLDSSKLRQAISADFVSEYAFRQRLGLLLHYALVDAVALDHQGFGRIRAAILDLLVAALGRPVRPAAGTAAPADLAAGAPRRCARPHQFF
jgi:hypothetical protein